MTANPIFCAIDTGDESAAAKLAGGIRGAVGGIKLGLEFFLANGPAAVKRVAAGTPLFLDLKLHDIPNTVAGAIRSVAPLGVTMTTLHASGGPAMLKAAVEAAKQSPNRPWLLGVTILTSLDDASLPDIGFNGSVADSVRRLAGLAQESGLDGAVCSPHEVASLRAQCGPGFKLVVPGIRPAGSDAGDQRRVMTPKEALAAGADILVIGRPITGAADPAAAAADIFNGLK